MLETLNQAVRTPEMRKKITFTLIMFLIFRIGTHIPVPGFDKAAIDQLVNQAKLLGFF